MPAILDRSPVVGFDMPYRSHNTNVGASVFVRTYRNDFAGGSSHNGNMARRGMPTQINWYLREWMESLGVKQAEMIRRTDWSKATMSQLYNNKQDYSPKIVNEAALALNVAPYELLMRPDTAMALRRLRQDALRVVEDTRPLDPPPAQRRAGGKRH
jgi:transcriptional regulator with XRE-family HTH domain